MAEIEIRAIADAERRRRVRALLPTPRDRVPLTKPMFESAARLIRLLDGRVVEDVQQDAPSLGRQPGR